MQTEALQPRNARPRHWKKLTTEAWSAATSRVPRLWRRVPSPLQLSGVPAKEKERGAQRRSLKPKAWPWERLAWPPSRQPAVGAPSRAALGTQGPALPRSPAGSPGWGSGTGAPWAQGQARSAVVQPSSQRLRSRRRRRALAASLLLQLGGPAQLCSISLLAGPQPPWNRPLPPPGAAGSPGRRALRGTQPKELGTRRSWGQRRLPGRDQGSPCGPVDPGALLPIAGGLGAARISQWGVFGPLVSGPGLGCFTL